MIMLACTMQQAADTFSFSVPEACMRLSKATRDIRLNIPGESIPPRSTQNTNDSWAS